MDRVKLTAMALFPLFLLFMTNLPAADYYKYRDENGVLHFTDNLNDVPEAQREKTSRFKKIESQVNPVDSNDASAAKKRQHRSEETFNKLDADEQLRQLNAEKRRLEKRYDALMKKVQLLEDERKKVKTAESAAAYRQEVSDLNKEIGNYEAERAAFDKKLRQYKQANPDKAQI